MQLRKLAASNAASTVFLPLLGISRLIVIGVLKRVYWGSDESNWSG